ncbi:MULTISPECIES: ATP-binding protein [unclassified Streptomyces]|uniref:ATP-binding protein n=1 Tax=unclassified Streptomyces TaxID=2593676 RepID=UPI0023651373|nr:MULTISPECIES: ATP-binding protein [unclassified Streptomyces]MDF3141595.1 ATP-binding protein [Streptomyces sp. T21Q-yed]WDF38390.1 ATP-binding protein [Streptomyces sp. T12]
MPRKPWDLDFTAEPEEVAALRRVMRLHLRIWGLHNVTDEAQLCVSELVSNVINHVGSGTPATLAVSMRGTRLRIEVYDPDTRALPTLTNTDCDAEAGRGMALIDAIAVRWGVELDVDRKATWCELATGLAAPNGHLGGASVRRAEALLGLYSGAQLSGEPGTSRLGSTIAEEAVIDVVTDLLHWLRAHGCDSDEIIDRAQRHFDAQAERTA